MSTKGFFALKAAALAAALLVLSGSPPAAHADGGRGRSGGSRGSSSGFRGSFGVSPGYRGGYSGYRGGYSGYRGGYSAYRGGYGGYGGYREGREGYRGGYYGYRGGYGGYYGGYSGLGLGLGIYTTPYLYDYSPTYVYSSPPSVVVTSSSVDTLDTTAPPPPPQPAAADETDTRARVEVLVPADAQVWFNGNPTAQRGEQRDFASPPLTPGRDYTYEIRARWNDNGRVVDQTRSIIVRANARIGVDFGQPESVGGPVPK